MMLLEHDAKELLRARGLPVPAATLARAGDAPAFDLPIVVKAQVPVGGRGKAGGIAICNTRAEADAALRRILALSIKGHAVRACRLEAPAALGAEAYVSFIVDPAAGNVRILMSASGGVDVEDEAHRAQMLTASADADAEALSAAALTLAASLPAPISKAMTEAAPKLAHAFVALEATLLEINPLFVAPDGAWMLGDAKLVLDDNALERNAALSALLSTQGDLYPEMAFKLEQGFDFVELDAHGDIGLVTTGAGLSMQLIDELVARGMKPFNFCDIRTGGFRGDPARLIEVFRRIAAGPSIRAVLINFFAGSTDLAEIARLLVIALKEVPELEAPITARMIGNGYDEARKIIADAGDPIHVETDLELAIDRVAGAVRA